MSAEVPIAVDGNVYEAPLVIGSEEERAFDVSGLRDSTGVTTFDPGLANTAVARSALTFIDGERGVLRHRGYAIEELAEHSTFLETSYLLIYGELPTSQQLHDFEEHITRHTLLREEMRPFFDSFPPNAHPMAIMVAGTAAMSTFYQDHYDPLNERDVEVNSYRLLAKLPTVAAWAYKRSIGQAFVYPDNDLSYTSNFLNMMFAVQAERYAPDPVAADALETLLILHADHEQNCSTSAVRMVGSSHVNMFAAISSGLSALWGPRHGGANQAVIEMLEEIRDGGGDAAPFVRRAKDKSDPFRLMGFGHRVYREFDPRARIIKRKADEVISKYVGDDPLFELAQQLEEVALSDDYFIERQLYPNVDFYSGLIYRALGIPVNMFTVLFALGRLPGWVAQWKEMIKDPDTRVGRPRQVYTGPTARPYVSIDDRA